MFFSLNTPIWLYPTAVDFRKGIDGLSMLISDELKLNPTLGQLFLFRDRGAKKIKALFFDRNGFWLLYKRLEKGRLKFPSDLSMAIELTKDQLNWLLSGLDCLKQPLLPIVRATHFY
jgi:transposase